MYKVYLREHQTGRMESVTRGLSPQQADAEYRRLLGREDLVGKPWAAVLRNDLFRHTTLFSRFDADYQRLLPTDAFDLMELEYEAQRGPDQLTHDVIAGRNQGKRATSG